MQDAHRGEALIRQPLAGIDPAGRKTTTLNTVLIVEDEYLIADDVARAFLTIGCLGIEMAADAAGALSSIQRRRPDGAVLDVTLRNKMDFSVADALSCEQVPFVFMTGHEYSVIPRRFGHVIRCQKPIAPADVVEALLRVARNGTKAPFADGARG
jgi:DNA-binding response OmpR family regulator